MIDFLQFKVRFFYWLQFLDGAEHLASQAKQSNALNNETECLLLRFRSIAPQKMGVICLAHYAGNIWFVGVLVY